MRKRHFTTGNAATFALARALDRLISASRAAAAAAAVVVQRGERRGN